MPRRAVLPSRALLVALAVAGCGGGQTRGEAFDPSWQNDDGAAAAAFQASFRSIKIPTGASVAVGVSGADTLIGAPLDSGPTWTFSHALDSRPMIAGTVVVGLGGGELFALDALTGARLWKRDAGDLLRGVGDDGDTTIVSLTSTTGRGSIVLAIRHDGSIIRQIEDEAAIGVPAVVDEYAFLPWKGQYVTIYDLHGGEETARILFRSATSRAFTVGGGLFFGESSLTRFDDQIGRAPRDGATRITLPARELPGAPRWMSPGVETPPLDAVATDKVRLYARPMSSGAPGVDGGKYAATYYRIAVGLNAKSGDVAWVYAHSADFLGGDGFQGGFALCDAAGKVTFLDGRRGAVAGYVSLGKPLTACVVQADGITRAAKDPAPSLAAQISEAVLMPQAELAKMQKMLLKELARLDDAVATRTLIELSSTDHTLPMLRDEARALLERARSGADVMLEALENRYDFMADIVRPPPVGPLADALAAMKETRAAPLLALHLNDPADSSDDVRRAAAALVMLATSDELEQIRTFFALYRGMAAPDIDHNIESAVISAAAALLKLGAADIVAFAVNDPFTSEALKPRLSELFDKKPENAAAR
jgi:outer membrane protein assembly factor BamB